MNAKELHDKTPDQLRDELVNLKKESFNLRFQQATSDANAQTVTVSVERRFTHPVLKKTIRKSKKYRAHDENNTFKVGDAVRIIECAPKSKTKRWEVLQAAEA